jgi:valyl-tRNA synthetase
MPFVTEEIWQTLAKLAPERGFDSVSAAADAVIVAEWPEIDGKWNSPETEARFALYQRTLSALREIRAAQQIGPKKQVKFAIKCDAATKSSLEPLGGFFKSMAASELTEIGTDVTVPEINATAALAELEIFVDLDGLIDIDAEIKRLEKERDRLTKDIGGKENKLSNEKFVNNAAKEFVDKVRDGLAQAKEQLETIEASLAKMNDRK